MSPTRAKVGDTVRITVQGFQVGSPGVSAWGVKKMKSQYGPVLVHIVKPVKLDHSVGCDAFIERADCLVRSVYSLCNILDYACRP